MFLSNHIHINSIRYICLALKKGGIRKNCKSYRNDMNIQRSDVSMWSQYTYIYVDYIFVFCHTIISKLYVNAVVLPFYDCILYITDSF